MTNHAADPFGIVGQVLDSQFRVDRLVGEGGFSAVYRGHHLGLQEPIAIKCLKLPPALSPPLVDQFEKRFRDESRILYRLSQGNLNIVRSIAGGTWTAPAGFVVPFMILEWMEGRSLANEFTIRRTVGQQGRTLQEVVKVFGPAADGLGYAHSQGVVHRDLNPGNLFFANTPQGVKMKVLDFGVAKILDDSALNIGPRTQTVGQIRIFAPAYGAPEQFDDALGKVGAASDVYAFALILMEAMRDRVVNDGTHLGEFAQKAIDPKKRPTPRSLGLDVPDEVEQIFTRATKLDPRERWQSAGELWQALAIAVSAASQQKHEQAAFETPALAMPPTQGVRSTQTGMGMPPAPSGPGTASTAKGIGGVAKTPGTARMDKTMPIGAVMPNLKLPRPTGSGMGPPPPSPRAQRVGVSGGPPPSAPRVGVAGASGPGTVTRVNEQVPTQRFPEEETRIAPTPNNEKQNQQLQQQLHANESSPMGESEDEVTRVRPPEPDVLRGLAEAEARMKNPHNQTLTQISNNAGNNPNQQSPRPAAGAPPTPAAGSPPPPNVEPVPPSYGGTMMMQPGNVGPGMQQPGQPGQQPAQPGPRPASGQLAKTMPLMGPHPLGAAVAAQHQLQQAQAAAAQQQQPPPQQQMMPPQQQQHHAPQTQMMQQQPMQQPPQQQQQPPPQQMQQQQPPMMQQPYQAPAFHQQQPQGQQGQQGQPRFGEASVSVPPQSIAGVPKKGNPMLLIGIIVGALLLIGVAVTAIVVVRGRGGELPAGSASASSSSLPTGSAPPPPTPATTDTPPPVVEADAAAAPTPDTTDTAVAPTPPTPPTPATDVTPTPPTPPTTPTRERERPDPVAVKDAGAAPVDPNAFDEKTARSRLAQANGVLGLACKKEGWQTGLGTANVTFNTDGTVGNVAMDPPFAGTPAGDCVAGQFKRQKASPFQGSPMTIRHSFEVPK